MTHISNTQYTKESLVLCNSAHTWFSLREHESSFVTVSVKNDDDGASRIRK